MTNTMGMARLITLIATLAAATALPVGAQETPPPQVEFLEAGPTMADERFEAESIEQYLDRETLGEPLRSDDLSIWDGCPAAPESTGTWLRRGYWSAEIDAVAMIRKWDINNMIMATDSTPTLRHLGGGTDVPLGGFGAAQAEPLPVPRREEPRPPGRLLGDGGGRVLAEWRR